MVDYNALKERLNKEDRFCAYNGIRLTEIREGYAEAELTVTEHSLNGLGIVQGGALFTLCRIRMEKSVLDWAVRFRSFVRGPGKS